MKKSFEHQDRVLNESKDLPWYAIFWEMGTGKTKLMLDTVHHLITAGKIDTVLVVAPNGVHRNWVEDEVPKWLPTIATFTWISGRAGSKRHKFESEFALRQPCVLVAISYEGFMTKRALLFVKKLFKRKVLMILDESSKIKTPSAKRTMKLVAAGRHVAFRRILTGTPVTNSPFDIYTQMRFLDSRFWKDRGFQTYAEFKNFYGIFKTMELTDPATGRVRSWNQTVAFKNLQHLQDLLKPVSSRVLKQDVLDLPPKLYTKRYFELSTEQQRVYKELRDESITFLASGELITTALALTLTLRLQQITSNYLPDDEDKKILISKKNPRIICLSELVDEIAGQAIIWARFRQDIDQIMFLLGDQAVRYDGAVSSDDRVLNKNKFQAGEAKFFVANPAVGATGLTLTAATTVVYYSNSFRLEDRLQSEDRAHRIGQEHSVQYVDIVAPGTIDMKIVKALRNKVNIASQITGDNLKEWI